jgi:hypothetical protein
MGDEGPLLLEDCEDEAWGPPEALGPHDEVIRG